MANIKDIAAKAGVSIATVSRALRQPELVKEKTARRIEEAVRELDYTPNLMATSLRRQKADAVIIAMMKFCDPEEFDFPVLKEAFDASGVKYLQIEVDQESEAYEQIKTRVQTFAEIL